MVDYVRLAALARRLIDANGRDVTVSLRSITSSNPTEPWKGSDVTSDDIPAKAVFVDYEISSRESSSVQEGDKRCLIATQASITRNPSTRDFIIDGSTQWKIVAADIIEPGDLVVLYDLMVRPSSNGN